MEQVSEDGEALIYYDEIGKLREQERLSQMGFASSIFVWILAVRTGRGAEVVFLVRGWGKAATLVRL